jgi:hypothetical protein
MLTRGYASGRRTRPRKGNVALRLFELERFYEAALAAKRGPSEEEQSAENIAAVLAAARAGDATRATITK